MNNKIKNVPVNSLYHEINNEVTKKWESNRSEKYKEYRRKWVENPMNFILENAPLHIDIEPTSACNLKCSMCPRTILTQSGNQNLKISTMSMDTFKKIIDEAVEIGVYSIKLNFRGEPLVHPNIVDMVKYAKEKGIEDVMFNTNAVLLNENMSKRLIEAGLDKIFFSFDSPHKEEYEKIRVGANFEETLNNIKKFVKIRDELGQDTPLTRVSMVLMDINRNEYQEFVDLFKESVDVIVCLDYEDYTKEKIQEYNSEFACSQLWQRMIILADGDVLACCEDWKKENIVGNINKDRIKNIWQNEKYKYIRKLHKDGEYNRIDICSKCQQTIRKENGTI